MERVQIEPNFLDNVITRDKIWTFEYDPETKHQSAKWHTPVSPKQKKERMTKSKEKIMLVISFNAKDVVHKEFVPPGQIINTAYYMDVLERLRKRVLCMRKEIATTWVIHHNNAPRHTALHIHEFLATQSQPPLQS